MQIGVVPFLNPSLGGLYQYSLAMLEALTTISRMNQQGDTYTVFIRPEDEAMVRNLDSAGIRIAVYGSQLDRLRASLKAWVGQGVLRQAFRTLQQQLARRQPRNLDPSPTETTLGTWLRLHKIDWVLYTTPDSTSFESDVPYVMPVFDLQHRLQPEFPEVSADGEWNEREYLYRNGTRQATLILADSDVGKEDILGCYGPDGITPDRVKVLPYVPAPYLSCAVPQRERMRVRNVYHLPKRFFFYPAQLWPHKNHMRIVQAAGRLKEAGTEINLVLCGSKNGAIRTRVFHEIMGEVDRLGISRQIYYIGYVPNDVMSALYAEAAGLVMPTFFGPTNIPIAEAWLFGCPVLTSDIRGIREQVGDAGLLVDPRSVESIAEGMRRLWEDDDLRADLAQRGSKRLSLYKQEDFCEKLGEIIAETNQRVAKWKSAIGKTVLS
jgi:glycosyltransferase involved in cell wall biosynthesis